jgi:ring-1,2-phenylacetyl-CoA epoxidase subunit PaaB
MKPDTQWPRFQVLLQEKEGKPHQDVGSVHAPDAELALLNARDVFARRPECTSMWVVPVEEIFSKTSEELDAWQPNIASIDQVQIQTYHVFNKEKSAGTQTSVGVIEADNPENALFLALKQYLKTKPPFAWWIIPDRAIKKSDPHDEASFYSPAKEKDFRMATDFKTLTTMRQIERTAKRAVKSQDQQLHDESG